MSLEKSAEKLPLEMESIFTQEKYFYVRNMVKKEGRA